MTKFLTLLLSFFLITAISISPTMARDKKDKNKKETKVESSDFESLAKKVQSEQLLELAKLKNQIDSKQVKDTLRLAKAIQHLEQGHDNAAFSLLDDISKHSILTEYVKYYKAKALLHQKEYKKGLKVIGPIDSPTKKIDLEKFWLRMHLLALNKGSDYETLKTEIAKLKKQRSKDKWVDIKGDYYQGLAEWVHGNKSAAKSFFTNVLVKYPGTEYDQKIFDLYKTDHKPNHRVLSEAMWNLRAEKLISSGFPHEAVKIWQHYYKKNPRYQERVAYGTFRARDYKEAAALYEELLKSGNTSMSEAEILKKIMIAYGRHDNFKNAIKTAKTILNKYPKSGAASLADFKLGFLYFDSQQYEKAIQYFERFVNKGSRWQKDRARWFRLWSFYLTKQYDQALLELDNWEKTNGRKKSDKVGLMYWKARIAEKLGQNDLAKSIYQKVKTWDGLDYYGLLARQRLAGKSSNEKTVIHPNVLSMVPKGNKKYDKDFNLKAIPQEDPLIKAILLAHIGLDTFAFDESRYSAHTNSITDFHVAKAVETAGNHNRGYAIRNQATSGSLPGANVLDGYRLAFPRAYNKFVEPYAKLWDMDENLAYAIMRQESAFKPEALSFAFAYGLMQIIPPTGEEIAQKIDYKDFQVSQLNNPIVNTLFGTYYLRYLLDEFDNDLVYAIAGYNAGPNAVKRWKVKAPGMERDEFIELIPYKETNKYVKKVLVNYMVYNKIYQ